MAIASLSNGLPIFRLGDVGCASNRFGNNSSDIALFLQHVLDVVSAFQIAASPLVAVPQTAVLIRWGDVLGSGQQGADILAEDGLSTD